LWSVVIVVRVFVVTYVARVTSVSMKLWKRWPGTVKHTTWVVAHGQW